MSRRISKKKIYPGIPGSSARPIDVKQEKTILDPKKNTYYLPEMTWIEVRDCIRDGRDTLLIVVGGYESNGPYTVLDKHNLILKSLLSKLSLEIPILIAPLIFIAPNRDPKKLYIPGTFEISANTFMSFLQDALKCYQLQGFKRLIVSTDHGGKSKITPSCINKVVNEFNEIYAQKDIKAIFYEKFYDVYITREWIHNVLEIQEYNEGIHDDIFMTAQLMSIDPTYVRFEQRKKKNKLSINGIDLSSKSKISKLGKKIIFKRLEHLVPEIKEMIDSSIENVK